MVAKRKAAKKAKKVTVSDLRVSKAGSRAVKGGLNFTRSSKDK